MSLTQQLQEQQDTFRQQAPQEVLAVAEGATDELAASGIIDGAPKKGTKLADFNLPNQTGETRSLSSLVANGPVVVTFYSAPRSQGTRRDTSCNFPRTT